MELTKDEKATLFYALCCQINKFEKYIKDDPFDLHWPKEMAEAKALYDKLIQNSPDELLPNG